MTYYNLKAVRGYSILYKLFAYFSHSCRDLSAYLFTMLPEVKVGESGLINLHAY